MEERTELERRDDGDRTLRYVVLMDEQLSFGKRAEEAQVGATRGHLRQVGTAESSE